MLIRRNIWRNVKCVCILLKWFRLICINYYKIVNASNIAKCINSCFYSLFSILTPQLTILHHLHSILSSLAIIQPFLMLLLSTFFALARAYEAAGLSHHCCISSIANLNISKQLKISFHQYLIALQNISGSSSLLSHVFYSSTTVTILCISFSQVLQLC